MYFARMTLLTVGRVRRYMCTFMSVLFVAACRKRIFNRTNALANFMGRYKRRMGVGQMYVTCSRCWLDYVCPCAEFYLRYSAPVCECISTRSCRDRRIPLHTKINKRHLFVVAIGTLQIILTNFIFDSTFVFFSTCISPPANTINIT